MYKVFKAISKNTVIAVVLMVMICLAAYINYIYKAPNAKQAIKSNTENSKMVDKNNSGVKADVSNDKETMATRDYFAQRRLDINKLRSEHMDYLKSVMDDKNISEQAKIGARNEYMAVAGLPEKEDAIEKTLAAKGFQNVVVWLNESNQKDLSADVTVGLDKIDVQKDVQIEDAVMSIAGISDYNKIKIIPIKK